MTKDHVFEGREGSSPFSRIKELRICRSFFMQEKELCVNDKRVLRDKKHAKNIAHLLKAKK